MTQGFTFEQIVKGMTDIGIDRAIAERQARRECGIEDVKVAREAIATVTLPFHLTIPWSMLVSDNDKFSASAVRTRNGETKPRMVLTARYKAGKEAISKIARDLVGEAKPVECPLIFVGYVYRPSQHRNDATNFAKLVQDALSKVVYDDDTRLFRVTWIKVQEPDVDRPRAEIEISKM